MTNKIEISEHELILIVAISIAIGLYIYQVFSILYNMEMTKKDLAALLEEIQIEENNRQILINQLEKAMIDSEYQRGYLVCQIEQLNKEYEKLNVTLRR